jgi:tetratricopeptide (TPR) repeat protein
MTEETLSQEALSRSFEERAAFLAQACARRPDLLAAVEALLAAREKSSTRLDEPTADPAQTVDPAPIDPGVRPSGEHTPAPDDAPLPLGAAADCRSNVAPGLVLAGRYVLQQKIGEGGMGEVWVAHQSEPVKRKVALKLIKAGMDSRAVLQRFEQERQALALMDHPNIARVLDGGLTPTGQPFFVMELVNGPTLNKYCDGAMLSIRQRLELFTSICQAVQHAHQKGVIHRDLKPANILVTLIDGRPAPKVIDFGVAKAIAGRLTDESLSTQFGAVVGTLEYMSPEQAGASGEDIDTRADIYSLGVILYELLTGLRPIEAKRLKGAAWTEMIRIVREEEPSKPSTRLSADELLPSLALSRRTEPKRLTALLRGELDWVVLKCLEKQRDRRYETANALARDVQRYLAGEVVEARPPSGVYRLRKFVHRHRAAVVAGGLIAAALVLGLIGTSLGLAEAERQRQAAEGQRDEKEEARAEEAAQRRLAETERDDKEKARAAEAEQRRAADQAYQMARESLLTVGADLPDVLRQAIFTREAQNRANAILAESLAKQLDLDTMRGLPERGLMNIHLRNASLQGAQGKVVEAGNSLQAALEISNRLVARDSPDKATLQGNHALILSSIGQFERDSKRTVAAGKAALEMFGKALQLQRDLLKDPGSQDRPVAELRQSVADTLYQIADTHRRMQGYREALAPCQECVELRKLVLEDGEPTRYTRDRRRLLAEAQMLLGKIQVALEKDAEAEAAFRAAVAAYAVELKANPNDAILRLAAARAARELGDFLLMRNRPDEVGAFYQQDLQAFRGLLMTGEMLAVRQELGRIYYRTATLALKQNDARTAADHYQRCSALWQEVTETQPTLMNRLSVGLVQARLGRHEAPAELAREVLNAEQVDVNAGVEAVCVLALCADAVAAGRPVKDLPGADAALRQKHLDAALEGLTMCVEKLGFKGVARLKTDPDFDPLRAEPRFQETIKRLEIPR